VTVAIIKRNSPNQSPRPEGSFIDAIILHADAGKSDIGTISWIQRPESKVSYHYLVGRTGTVYQFVPDDRKAWHAGVSSFEGRAFCNNYSLGVSFANDQKGEPFTALQLSAGVELVAELCRTYEIPLNRITTHAAVSPGRKTDPGKLFPLHDFLARVGSILALPPT
jgi:N-acetylmuramoyl-L-alanine amidase